MNERLDEELKALRDGEARPLAFSTHLRYADVGNQLRHILQSGLVSYRLAGVGHFDTPFGTIDYPVKLFGP